MKTKQTLKAVSSTTVLPNGMKSSLSWSPESDPQTEDRIRCMAMSDHEYWNAMMRLINVGRTTAVTFEKRIIKWT
ncbi:MULTISPECIES: hypothetical protein [unclassified Imperialibacter]|uniref:hypothetical protein n=1 Tax=unclassified Imperialibacter TaxID=2629706 RepID=UPI00125FFE08|nr:MULTISPECIES: hypothetical protein [unclassified Imperialibacter]